MKSLLKSLLLLVVVALFSLMGFAATQAVGASSLATTMQVNVNVQTALELTLSTGTGSSCAISAGSGSDYQINLGNVNGLGLNGASNCASYVGMAPQGSGQGAIWATNYQVTPSFSGFSGTTANIAVTAPAFTTSNSVAKLVLVEGGSNTTAALTAVPTAPGATTHTFTSATSGTALSRYIGVQVSNAGTGFSGSDSTVVTFTMTVQ